MKTYRDCWISSAKALFSQALAGEPQLTEVEGPGTQLSGGIAFEASLSGDSMGQFIGAFMRASVLEAVQKLKPLAQQAGCTLSQFSLAWILREPNVASAIVGASRPEQLDENAAASGLIIDPKLFRQAEEIVGGIREGG